MTRWLIDRALGATGLLVLTLTGLLTLALWGTGCEGVFISRGMVDGTDGCLPDARAQPGNDAGGGQPSSDAGNTVGPGALPMTLSAIGSPSWKPECAYAFAAPCGSKASAFSTAVATIGKVLPAHQYYAAQNVMGPGAPHGQYAQELASGLAAAGLTPGSSFSAASLQPPSCIFVLLQLVAGGGAPSGSSPDFASGPILDPSAFPLLVDGSLLNAGKLVDPALDFEYPAKKSLVPEPAGQSYSHVPLVFFENSELIQPQVGAYSLELRAVDALKHGWNIAVHYSVK